MAGLPPGETDPNLLYIAVGRAIHAWEGLEEELAQLYLLFAGLPYSPDTLAAFGKANRKFHERMIALGRAAEIHFVRHPNQQIEGDFKELLGSILELAIERHRIAHGHITMMAEVQLPPDHHGYFEVSAHMLYRWGSPFYAADNLRTDPFGVGASQIDAWHDAFSTAHNKVYAFIERLWPSSREK